MVDDNDNVQRLPYYTQDYTGTSDDPARDSQPEVQQPAHSQQKPTRHFFGIPQRAPQVRGNDPLDYEQKFPEDKRYEELSPFARVWRTYLEECGAFDTELLEGWRDGLNVLLVFVGLFSAVVTTFIVQTSQSLQANYSQVTATLLFELINVQRAAANGSLVNDVPRSDLTPFSDFRPTISNSLVNALWFTSLAFSLATALFAVLTKQWIHQYVAMPSGTPQDRCRVRQFRYMGLEQWGVGFIIGLLPLLLSVSLGIFLVGLVVFLVPLQRAIASIVGTITFVTFSIYFISNLLPIWFPSCPYKTPLSQYIFLSYVYIVRLITLVSSASTIMKPPQKDPSHMPPPHKFRDIERATVDLRADDLDVFALAWLSNMSSNPSVQNIVMQSTSALPLRSVEPLKQYAERFSNKLLHDALDHMATTDQESTIDRLIRVHFRFHIWSPNLMHIDQPSTETSAEVLCVDYWNSSRIDEIAKLVKAQFMEPTDKPLCLQPVVWARFLELLLPFTPESGLVPLLLMIPWEYWSANHTPPSLFPKTDLKIRSISHQDHLAVPLETAVHNNLYPDVANAFFEDFAHALDSLFHPDPSVDEFPAPQDPRLHALLAMAGSPSIRKVPITIPFQDCLFKGIMLNIVTYMDVHKSLLDNNFPSFKLDGNRYSVLKLLYTLISSDEFGGASMPNLDQCITLVTFLRVLRSTSPRPRFLPENWCTPSMASKFAQNVLPDTKIWTLRDSGPGPYNRVSESDELIYYFLQYPPVVNHIFSHFVSGRHLDRISKLRGDDIALDSVTEILDLFIVQMTPDVLDHQVLQQFKAYIFEPENLFTICAVHICTNVTNHRGLRRLAQVHPDHPAWPECLWRLDITPLAEYFERESGSLGGRTSGVVSEFREFVEGGCVGSFGLPTPAPVQDENSVNEPSLMKSLLRRWKHRDTAAKTEGIMMNTTGVGEV
ncbi:hypothetical protein IW262DRAFT_1299481 [Armillaria fumosa]|nr:hypothetical protein IW262DRAFT_1299481 [Armillaria fumosa]